MSKAKLDSLVEAICTASGPARKTWVDGLPDDLRDVCHQVKERVRTSGLKPNVVARALRVELVGRLGEDRIPVTQTIASWFRA